MSFEESYARRVIQTLTDLADGAMKLHGRELYNMFGLYGQELKIDILDLLKAGLVDEDLRPKSMTNTTIFSEVSLKNIRRLRLLWDCVSFVVMSHKMQNIKRRALARGSSSSETILYLRGADYQLAFSQNGSAIGFNTEYDVGFSQSILSHLHNDYIVTRAISPCDLTIYMSQVPIFVNKFGSDLSTVLEFARIREAGFFFSPANWRERILQLLPSASLFLVYVSNQSKGLKHELETLWARGLADHTIIVLDDRRVHARETFFALQRKLEEQGESIYLSVERDACMVEDPEAFERLIAGFPHIVSLSEDSDETLRAVQALIPQVSRSDVSDFSEFPLEFEIQLSTEGRENIRAFQEKVERYLDERFNREFEDNWAVLLLYLELSILLQLAHGEIVRAARSTAALGVFCACMNGLLSSEAPQRAAKLGPSLGHCGRVASNIARDALAMGEWNDYSDRRTLAEAELRQISQTIVDAVMRSIKASTSLFVKELKPDVSRISEDDRRELVERYNALVGDGACDLAIPRFETDDEDED